MSNLIFFILALTLSALSITPVSSAATELQDHDDIYTAVKIFAGDVAVQEVDPRLRLTKCSRALAIRYPFSVETTVEVRCPTDRGWKIFLTLSPNSTPAESITNSANLDPMQQMPGVVAKRQLQRGIAIGQGDLKVQNFPTIRLKNGHFSDPRDALGMEPNQTIPKGTLIASNMLRPQILVRKGDAVTIIFERNGLSVSNEGIALENGGLREKIKVELPDNKKIIAVTVQAAGLVKIP